MPSTCLDKIIGVTSKTDIPHYADLDADLQTEIAISSSGLFLDKLTGGIDLYAIEDDTYMPKVLNLAIDARDEAVKVLNDELLLPINNRFHAAKTKYIGSIGRRTVSATSTSSGNNQGHRYRMHEPIAGYISISAISVNVNGVGNFNVYVARCDVNEKTVEEVLYTFPVISAANVWTNCDMTSQPTGIQLPMQVNGEPQEYYIYWKRDEAGGLFAKNNDIKCSLCDKAGDKALSGFMQYDGISFSDMNNLKAGGVDKLGHGISVRAVVGCDHSMVICREAEKKDAVLKMMQWAALYKAGSLWIEYLIKSGYINKEGLQNREYFWGKRNNFEKEFSERITSIANAMELGETECYVCKDDTMFKATIFS